MAQNKISKKTSARKKQRVKKNPVTPQKLISKSRSNESGKTKTDDVQSRHQQLLEIALKAVHLGIWEWDIQKNTIEWTDNLYSIYGLKKGEAMNFDLFQSLILPDDRDNFLNNIQHTLETGTSYFIQHRFKHSDGSIRWAECIGKVFRNKKNMPVKMIGTTLDITEKKVIELEKDDWKKRYEIITAASGQIVYDYDIPSGNILWAGNTDEVVGIPTLEMGDFDQWQEMIHPDDRSHAFRELEVAKSEQRPYNAHYRFSSKAGSYNVIHDKGTFISDEKGEPRRVLGTMTNVTNQVETQNSLVEKTLFIERMTLALPDIIHVFDLKSFKTIYYNKNVVTDLGYSEPETAFYREHIDLLLHPDDQQKFANLKTKLNSVKDGEIITGEYRILQKDGQWRWMLIVYAIFRRDDDGKPSQIIGTSRNITEQKQISETLKKQNEQLHTLTEELRKKVMQLEEFTQIVSHNLRSPVGNIVTLLDHYEKSESETEKKEFFKYLKEASQDTFLTLNELNEVLRIKQDVYLKQEELSFNKVLLQVESMLRGSIADSGAIINRDFQVGTIHYASIYLESLFLNLLSNSIKYRHRTRNPVILIKTYPGAEGTVLEISDNGLGLDMNKYGHQLFRMRKTFHLHPEARGVGLFITKNQIETSGGEIEAYGKEGEGMTFIIKFKK